MFLWSLNGAVNGGMVGDKVREVAQSPVSQDSGSRYYQTQGFFLIVYKLHIFCPFDYPEIKFIDNYYLLSHVISSIDIMPYL